MTEPNIPVAAIGKRGWHRSIAAKLLIAFGLIAALTVGASWLSLIRFNQVDAVMRQLTGVSLPLVKLSFSIESKTVKLVTSASELAESETDVEQFERMELLSGQVGELWGVLRDLQAIVADKATTIRLQQIVAALNGELGAIDRSTREFVQILIQRKRATEEVARIDAKLLAQLAPIVEQFGSRVAVALDRTDTASLDRETLKSDVALLRTVYAVRADINRMADLLNRIANASDSQGLSALKNQLVASRDQLRRDVATIEKAAQRDAGPHAEFRRTIDSWIANATGESGVAALQTRYLQQRQAIAGQQKSLQTISDNLRNQVAALVQEAEREASATTERSAQAIERSRIWLVLIALASLLIAGLIVWLFVLRYVARRLTALADSMLAIARGELDTPIPAARADELGDMSRTLAVFRDNSREIRIARDEAEQAKAEAEAASRTKSSFLANMSHELRTPLNAIIGYSEILVEESVDNGDAAMVADLEKIQGAGKHLLGLINGILDLSKIEAGRMDVYLEQVHLARLVDEVRVIVEPLVAKNGSKLVTLYPPDIGSMRTDLTKLRQNLINLMSNAAKFTKDGTITLAVSRQSAADGPPRIVFAVSDTGIGMNEEQLGRLFQAFTQADSSTTRNFGGTGLGLTITRHFATLLGGTIGVVSKPGEGSTFTMTLPDQSSLAAPAAADMKPVRESGAVTSGLTVLVVDDDPTVHELLSPSLVKEGYRVLQARDGAEALAVMRKTPPDIVTLDVMMPNVDGWTVLGMMKSDPALDQIPVIMVTIVDDRNLGFTLGASEFMTKPIDRTRLLALVRVFTSQKPQSQVLIVDDDADVRELVRSTLETAGLTTAQAGDGHAALDWLNSHPLPALILLDLMMPEMDGFTFLEELRKDEDLLEVPVVVLTAKELTDEERAFLVERTILVLSKSAQPIGRLGSALAALAKQRAVAPRPENSPAALSA